MSVLHSLADLEPVSGIAIARDGVPVGVTAMDPSSFAITKFALASLNPDRDGTATRLARDQAFATGRLVMRFNARPFEDYQLAAFPAFAESIETGDPEAAEAVGRFFGFSGDLKPDALIGAGHQRDAFVGHDALFC
jgi:hypothetical protein